MLSSSYLAILNVFICTFLSYFIAPFIKNIGNQYKIVDIPNTRKVHKVPIVRIGGLSIFSVFFVYFFSYENIFNLGINNHQTIYLLYTILIGSSLFFMIGIHDDIFKSSPFLRLPLQFLTAFVVFKYGINFNALNFYIPYFGEINVTLNPIVDFILTSFWIVGITNAINWLDGIDALAAGYSAILSFGLCILMIFNSNFIGILFFSILFGSTLGFLIRNFKPAYYIMGDCGSNFLGFCLSTSGLIFLKDSATNSINFLNLILIFSLPIGDMLTVILGRIMRGKNIFFPDKSHFHHKLMDLNFDYKNILFLMYFYSSFSVFIGILFLRN